MNSLIPLINQAYQYKNKVAIIDENGTYTYEQLLEVSAVIAQHLLEQTGKTDLNETRVAFMAMPNFYYAAIQWGIWQAGGIAVPLGISHPIPEIEYILDDTQAEVILTTHLYQDFLAPLAQNSQSRHLLISNVEALPKQSVAPAKLPEVPASRRALIIYTSGTTNRPKGVVTTHEIIKAQITSLTTAWGWTEHDVILHTLPLHHVHGIVNILYCALWSGARCEMMSKFDAQKVWDRFTQGELTLFMAVPTVYNRLIEFWNKADRTQKTAMSEGLKSMRLMVSGSAALPVSVLLKWKEISGQTLLERYGMTEIGMAISNPLLGERKPGYIGRPLPGVEVQLIGEDGELITGPDDMGEIRVKSPSLFLEYWGKEVATKGCYDDGWFCTGDIAVRDKDGYYRILGRSSVDIIKSGGYKISALEVEEVLRKHPKIAEVAVVGVPSDQWGEQVSVAVVAQGRKKPITLDELREWAQEFLSKYKIPTAMMVVNNLPRNAMGKVTKPSIVRQFQQKK
ncbi:acyl-CoA synthetase [uncultured Microscilla sp.]|uniref:acyl-CoA synthetase n=1 Tax=uncultured Microscilla sp. TaxID=432653 RepID=UPI002619EA21|nr:acyl-CoA synthetase [uncultured Microscilla sp.]